MEERKMIQLSNLIEAVHKYMKTGEKNKLLKNFEQSYGDINKKFSAIMEMMPEKETAEDIFYLSCISILGKLYEKEEKRKQQQEKYTELTKKYPELSTLVVYLFDKKVSTAKELEINIGIPSERMEEIICGSNSYFKLREKEDIVEISLSRQGKLYATYLLG